MALTGFTAALAAGANAGQGFLQGQRQALADKMNQLAYDSAQLSFQQKQTEMVQQQAEADYAMSLFNPTIQNPVNGQPVSGQSPDNVTPQQGQQPEMSPFEKAQKMAAFAASQGDTAGANEWMKRANDIQKNALDVQTKQLEMQVKLGQVGAQDAQMFPEGLAGAQQFLAYEAQKGYLTPEQFANLKQGVIADPTNWKQRVVSHGMTAAQNAQQQLAKMRYDQQVANDAQQQADRQATLAETVRYHNAQIQHQQRTEKGRGTVKPLQTPSEGDISSAMASVQQALDVPSDQWDPNARSGAGGFKNVELNRIAMEVASQAKALVQRNTSLTYEDAKRIVLQQMQKDGAISNHTTVTSRLGGLLPPTKSTETSFTPQGTSKDNAIPYKPDIVPIPGKVYSLNGMFVRANGNGTWQKLP